MIYLINSSGHTLNALHLGYVAALLRAKNIDFFVVDLEPSELSANFGNLLKDRPAKIIVFLSSLMNPCLNVKGEAIIPEFAHIAKEINPTTIIIKDGIRSTLFTEDELDSGYIDISIIGESDFTFVEVIESLLKGQDLSQVKGIAFRHGSDIIHTPPRPLIEDLDSLPFPLRTILARRHFENRWHYCIVSRGCPFPCTICQPITKCIFGVKARYVSVSRAVDEIEYIQREFGPIKLQLWGDTFTVNRNWVIGFCEEILRTGLKFSWLVGTRADCIDYELAKKMKSAGCVEIGYGVEASNEEMRNKLIKKCLSLDSIYRALQINKKVGLITRAAFMIGLPAKNLSQVINNLLENIKIILETHPEWLLISNASPVPGTDFYNYSKRLNILKSDSEWDINVGRFSSSNFTNVSVFRIWIEFIVLLLVWVISNPLSILRVARNRIIK